MKAIQSLIHIFTLSAVISLCYGRLTASELRTLPLHVYTQNFSDGETRICVDWGSQGKVVARDAREMRREYDELVRWATSPAIIDILKKEQAKMEEVERGIGKAQVEHYHKLYRETPQVTQMTTVRESRERTETLPEWLKSIAWDMRKDLVVCYADPTQPGTEQWLLRQRKVTPQATIFVVAWKSEHWLKKLNRRHPDLMAMPIISTATMEGGRSADAWVHDYLVEQLPAVVTFPSTTTLHIREGIGQ